MERLKIEMVKMKYWIKKKGERVIRVLEGRDEEGKGGKIFKIRKLMKKRKERNVEMKKKKEKERGKWYLKR